LCAIVPAVLSWSFYLIRSNRIILTEHQLIYQAELARSKCLDLNEINAIKFKPATLEFIPFGALWSIEISTSFRSIHIPAQIVHQELFLGNLCFRTGLSQPDIPVLFSGNDKYIVKILVTMYMRHGRYLVLPRSSLSSSEKRPKSEIYNEGEHTERISSYCPLFPFLLT
jgi:hypothetical protein